MQHLVRFLASKFAGDSSPGESCRLFRWKGEPPTDSTVTDEEKKEEDRWLFVEETRVAPYFDPETTSEGALPPLIFIHSWPRALEDVTVFEGDLNIDTGIVFDKNARGIKFTANAIYWSLHIQNEKAFNRVCSSFQDYKASLDSNGTDTSLAKSGSFVLSLRQRTAEKLGLVGIDKNNVVKEAVEKNASYRLKLLLNHGIIDCKNDEGMTGVMYCAKYNAAECLKLLLEVDASVIHTKDNNGKTGLMHAAAVDAAYCLDILLAAGAFVKDKDIDGKTALMLSSCHKHPRCLKPLLKACCAEDINARDNWGETSLVCAAGRNAVECMDMLLCAGASVAVRNNDGRTALSVAASANASECLKLLLKTGASIENKDRMGNTPTMLAASANSLGCLRLLLAKNASITERNTVGENALMLAASADASDCMRLLLDHIMKPNALVRLCGLSAGIISVSCIIMMGGIFMNATVLGGAACALFNRPIAGVKKDRYVNSKNKDGMTAAMYSARYDAINCLKLLLEAKASVHIKDSTGKTALMHAALTGSVGCLNVLLAAGASVKDKDEDGKTALDLAKIEGHESIINALGAFVEKERERKREKEREREEKERGREEKKEREREKEKKKKEREGEREREKRQARDKARENKPKTPDPEEKPPSSSSSAPKKGKPTSPSASESSSSKQKPSSSNQNQKQRPQPRTNPTSSAAPRTETPKEEDPRKAPERRQIVERILKETCYYKILGVQRKASTDEIKKVYQQLVCKVHPDKNLWDGAGEAFDKLKTAFDHLSSPEKRWLYDLRTSGSAPW